MNGSAQYLTDPRLLQVVRQLENTGGAAELLDREWQLVWVSDDVKTLLGENDEDTLGYGAHILAAHQRPPWRTAITEHSIMRACVETIPLIAYDTPGGVNAIRKMLDEDLAPFVPETDDPRPPPPFWSTPLDFAQHDQSTLRIWCHSYRLHDDAGELFGFLNLYTAALPAHLLALVARGDEAMFERMAQVAVPDRRAAAVLFADLESSGILSRRLSTEAYFRLIRAITSAVDDAVIERRGIIGKHAGDGVTAFFLTDDLGSDSGAAKAALDTARGLSRVASTAAGQLNDEGIPVAPSDCRLNIGLHWGSSLFIGQIVTGGRLEVTALGDEVNECARIEQTARQGQVLASKTIIEHLSTHDATALGLRPDQAAYHALPELPGADDKARRDAAGIAVTELSALAQ